MSVLRQSGAMAMIERSRSDEPPAGKLEVPMTHSPDAATAILASLEDDVAAAKAKAIKRLARLPAATRHGLDPYGLLLRPRGQGARRRD